MTAIGSLEASEVVMIKGDWVTEHVCEQHHAVRKVPEASHARSELDSTLVEGTRTMQRLEAKALLVAPGSLMYSRLCL